MMEYSNGITGYLIAVFIIYSFYIAVTSSSLNDTIVNGQPGDNFTDCGPVPNISHGEVVVENDGNVSVGAVAYVICDSGYETLSPILTCQDNGDWENWDTFAACEAKDCGEVPNITAGSIALVDIANSSYGAMANVTCNKGYIASVHMISCLETGHWDDNITCSPHDLGIVKVTTGQEFTNGQHSAFLRCSFNVVDVLKYRIKWYINSIEFYNTGLLSSKQTRAFVLTDMMFTENINSDLHSQLFGSKVTCSGTVFDDAGVTEYETGTSPDFIPFQVSTDDITMMRGKEKTFTVFLNIPFGCHTDSSNCLLKFVLYDAYDSYNCLDSTVAAVSSDTCGGKIEGATQATAQQVTTTGTITNITITTKNNWLYRSRRFFSLVLKLAAVGNAKLLWNTPSTSITVHVMENYYTRYRRCYSYVDPYMYTFDRRWYSNQLIEEFVLLRHKTLPIEVQTVTTRCNRYTSLTCSCAVTVRAGGDVFTINHCHGHLTGYLSAKDGIMRVYKLWSTYYKIMLPTGMRVYVYVMPYLYYMMNIYVTPAPSDFEQMEGLCGNFNGDYSDDTILRGTSSRSSVESANGYWWLWRWWSNYFYPHDFAYSWGLSRTGRFDESLLNPDVYENVESWDNDKKLCVCPYAHPENNYQALCSANEDATCTYPIWSYGTLIEVSLRNKRDVRGSEELFTLSGRNIARRLIKMRRKWHEGQEFRKTRDIDNDTAIDYDAALQICEDQLNNECDAYSKKENVSEVSNLTDNLDNCARDTMAANTTEWVQSHCDCFTQEVTVELEKDVEFSENNTELVESIRNASCPGKCSGNGECFEGKCVCNPDFATDLCLLNITAPPLLEELADDGICDVNTDPCDYILIVGDGFIEGATCNITVYGAGHNGTFILTEEFEMNCTYLNYNELLAPTSINGSVGRHDVTDTSNATTDIAYMVGVSVSNDGSHFSTVQLVVILDTTCQQTEINDNNDKIVMLKTGFCYIAGTCYASGSYMTNSACDKCDSSKSLFYWTNGCDVSDKSVLVIVLATVCSLILMGCIALALIIYFNMKAKKARVAPLIETPLGASKPKFWPRKFNEAFVVEDRLEGAEGENSLEGTEGEINLEFAEERKKATEYESDVEEM